MTSARLGRNLEIGLDPGGHATGVARIRRVTLGTAALEIVEPPATVTLTGSWLGDRWRLAGALSASQLWLGSPSRSALSTPSSHRLVHGHGDLDVELPIAGSAPIIGELGIVVADR